MGLEFVVRFFFARRSKSSVKTSAPYSARKYIMYREINQKCREPDSGFVSRVYNTSMLCTLVAYNIILL